MAGLLRNKFSSAISKFRTDAEYNELIRTSFFALLVRMAGVVTGFIVTLLTSRYFGAGALGIVSICIAILSFSSVFGKLGLDVALMKYVASFAVKNNYAAIKSVYLNALKTSVPVSLIISAILYFSAPFMAENIFHKSYLTHILQINAWLTLPLVLVLINSEAVRGLKKIRAYTFLQTVSVSVFAAVLLVIATFFTAGEFVPVKIQFISIVLSAIVSSMIWMYYSNYRKSKPLGEVTSGILLKTSSSMFTTTLMQLLMSWAATLILAAYVSESDIGIYNALVRIAVFTNITILAVNSLTLPRFAEAYSSNNFEAMRKNADEAARLIFLTSLPVFILLILFPHFILSVFGKEFPGNETELYILLGGQFITCFCGLPAQLLNMAGRQHILRNLAIVSAIVNAGCCFILIPLYGIKGACIAQLAGTFTWSLLSVYSVKRYFGFWTFFRL